VNEQQRAVALHAAVLLADAALLDAQRALQIPTVPCIGSGDGKPCPRSTQIPVRNGIVRCESCEAQR
jgi:hypothetical protein